MHQVAFASCGSDCCLQSGRLLAGAVASMQSNPTHRCKRQHCLPMPARPPDPLHAACAPTSRVPYILAASRACTASFPGRVRTHGACPRSLRAETCAHAGRRRPRPRSAYRRQESSRSQYKTGQLTATVPPRKPLRNLPPSVRCCKVKPLKAGALQSWPVRLGACCIALHGTLPLRAP